MGKIVETATRLLASGEVQVVIGFSEGSNGRVRPCFARDEQSASKLIWDERCTQNLAVYIYKKESAKMGKPAIVSTISTLRSIVRLAAERQIHEGDVVALFIGADAEIVELKTLAEMENYLSKITPNISDADQALLDKLNAMPASERWEFWQKEMESCIKCYACRQACPLCYCTQCTVEVNQPQWITVGANKLGNMEWHIMRAMHLAGRCIECGQCGEACPVGIPIHLLPMQLAANTRELYGLTAGMNSEEGCTMSTYKPGDKESFIG